MVVKFDLQGFVGPVRSWIFLDKLVAWFLDAVVRFGLWCSIDPIVKCGLWCFIRPVPGRTILDRDVECGVATPTDDGRPSVVVALTIDIVYLNVFLEAFCCTYRRTF